MIAWCLKNGLEFGKWENETESLLEQVSNTLKREAFLSIWDEHKCLLVNRDNLSTGFTQELLGNL